METNISINEQPYLRIHGNVCNNRDIWYLDKKMIESLEKDLQQTINNGQLFTHGN